MNIILFYPLNTYKLDTTLYLFTPDLSLALSHWWIR